VRPIAERVRDAYASGRPLRVKGAGTWLGAGRPTRADTTLSLADHHGIVEYVPGDLTLTAKAGTPISEIVAATKANGQWLPLDPFGGDGGSLGATISTASAGPHAFAMGLPRDVVLGLEFVSGTGETIRAGGRVVKNVAGFDLVRLVIGSWGTLGVITEVTVRLRARPAHTRTLAVDVETSARTLNALATRLRALPFTPLASELVNATLAVQLGVGSRTSLLVRLGGNEESLRGQLELLRTFGEHRDISPGIWRQLRAADEGGGDAPAAAWRWSQLPALFGETWTAAELKMKGLDGAFAHGNPARGVVRVIARGESAQLARAACAFTGTIAIESLPADAWPAVTALAPPPNAVSRAIRMKFDPKGILNPGIMDGLA